MRLTDEQLKYIYQLLHNHQQRIPRSLRPAHKAERQDTQQILDIIGCHLDTLTPTPFELGGALAQAQQNLEKAQKEVDEIQHQANQILAQAQTQDQKETILEYNLIIETEQIDHYSKSGEHTAKETLYHRTGFEIQTNKRQLTWKLQETSDTPNLDTHTTTELP